MRGRCIAQLKRRVQKKRATRLARTMFVALRPFVALAARGIMFGKTQFGDVEDAILEGLAYRLQRMRADA